MSEVFNYVKAPLEELRDLLPGTDGFDCSVSALHQQQGGMSLRAFAEQSGLSERHIQNCAKAGRIVGARQNPLTKKWWIYPPAKLLKGWSL